MKLELFSDAKWEIISELLNQPKSALDLSQKFGTTVSNISQQLKILEYSGLIDKRKARTNNPGKAKTIYFLKENKNYIISLGENGAKKKELNENFHQTLTINIWLYASEDDKYFLEKFFWENEKIIEKARLILLNNTNQKNKIKLTIISDEKITNLKLKMKNEDKQKEFIITNLEKITNSSKNSVILLNKQKSFFKKMGDYFE